MALINCVESKRALRLAAMGNGPWQERLKRIGITQKYLAELLGKTPTAISANLSGKVAGGTSRYVKIVILALERLTPAERDEIIDELMKDEKSDD